MTGTRPPPPERFLRSIKAECLDNLILFGEKSLRHVLREYVAHYHAERNPQGIENVISFPDERLSSTGQEITKSERLGGLLQLLPPRSCLNKTGDPLPRPFPWADSVSGR